MSTPRLALLWPDKINLPCGTSDSCTADFALVEVTDDATLATHATVSGAAVHNPTYSSYGDEPENADLGVYAHAFGHAEDEPPGFIVEIQYRNAFTVDERRAGRMLARLRKANARLRKIRESSPPAESVGAALVQAAMAIGAVALLQRIGGPVSFYTDAEYHATPILQAAALVNGAIKGRMKPAARVAG